MQGFTFEEVISNMKRSETYHDRQRGRELKAKHENCLSSPPYQTKMFRMPPFANFLQFSRSIVVGAGVPNMSMHWFRPEEMTCAFASVCKQMIVKFRLIPIFLHFSISFVYCPLYPNHFSFLSWAQFSKVTPSNTCIKKSETYDYSTWLEATQKIDLAVQKSWFLRYTNSNYFRHKNMTSC